MNIGLKSLITGMAICVAAAVASPVQAEYVKVSDDLTLYYETAGSGDTTILFVPGWAMSSKVFERQLTAFEASTEYTFVTYDPRGQGRSSKTAGGHFYQQHGRDLAALIDTLKLKNIVLGGWSFGGNEALSYVKQFGSDSLSGFIMIDAAPSATGTDNQKEWVWYRHDDADGFEAFFTMGPLLDRDATNKGFADWMLADKSQENLDFAVGIAEQTPPSIAALLNAAGAHDDFTADLTAMEGKVPLLYIVRESWDSVVTGWAKANTPGATVSATMVSHLGFWEKPESFNAELKKFLDSIK